MKIAIQGHPTRGKEVIQILESLGGKNTEKLEGIYETFYYIDNKNEIGNGYKKNFPPTYKFYTLEEFEKEFPFKVGDKVTIVGLPDFPKVITQMVWDCDEILYSFESLNNTWFGAKSLKKFEMKEERNITLTLDKAKEWYKKGGDLKQVALQAFTEEELTKVDLPRTWEEFCTNYPSKKGECYIGICSAINSQGESDEVRDIEMDRNVCPSKKSAKAHLAMMQLEQLRDCWRQGWKPKPGDSYYTIKFGWHGLDIHRLCTIDFLSFPTKKMAMEFLNCFKDLIIKAGDLI